MKGNIFKFYIFVVVLCFGFLIYIYNNFNVIQFSKVESNKLITVNDFTVNQVDSNTVILTGKIPDSINQNYAYGFYTVHKSVKFYVGNELYYSFNKGTNPFGNTAGLGWHFINIGPEDATKDYHIEFDSSYNTTTSQIPSILFGEKYDILKQIIKDDLIEAIICIILTLAGLILISCWFILKQKAKINKSLLYLGLFSIFFSIWSFNELKISALIFNNHLITSNLSFIMLMLMVLPFVLFTKDFFLEDDCYVYTIVCYLSLINIVICLSLQVFCNIDFKLTLWMTHIVICLFAISQIYLVIKELIYKSITKKIKVSIFGSLIILFGVTMDIFLYYSESYDSNIFGRGCYFVYIIMLASTILKETSELIQKGREVEIYEKLAFTDTLTGLHNRTKFINDINLYDTKKIYANIEIFVLDLNDLKKYNDTLGHDIGDNYIIAAANIIKETFQLYGDCYRIGGDEFCVIINKPIEKNYKDLVDSLRETETSYNLNLKDIKVQIACGFARYNSVIDNNIDDILKRADTSMYHNKRELKISSL